jgi:hypothetical protein
VKLHIEIYKEYELGIRATVGLHADDGKEIYRTEVNLWDGDSRRKFIQNSIRAANGNLSDNERAAFTTQWDKQLRHADSTIKQTLKEQRLRSAKPETLTLPKELTPEERAQAIEVLTRPSLLFVVGLLFARVGTCR